MIFFSEGTELYSNFQKASELYFVSEEIEL